MGGKLFHLPRMPRAEYVEREAAVRTYLDQKLPDAYRIPRYYADKPDFGAWVEATPQDEIDAAIIDTAKRA